MAGTVELLNAAWIAFYNNKPQARLSAPTDVSITNNTNTSFQFTSSTIDNWNGHSNITNPSRYAIQVAGKYLVSGQVSFVQNGTGLRLAWLAQNGTEVVNTRTWATASSTTLTTVVVPPTLLQCAVGDYIELNVYQNSGGALNTDNGSGSGGGVQLDIVYQSQ